MKLLTNSIKSNQINACWVEAVRKESKGRILNEKFDFNPKNRKCSQKSFSRYRNLLFNANIVIAITSKPTSVNPHIAQTVGTAGDADGEAELAVLQDKLESLKRQPKKKFNYPQTAAQELGWDMDTDFKAHAPNYGKNRVLCAETQYANSYVTFQHRSPFAAIRPAGAEAQPGKK